MVPVLASIHNNTHINEAQFQQGNGTVSVTANGSYFAIMYQKSPAQSIRTKHSATEVISCPFYVLQVRCILLSRKRGNSMANLSHAITLAALAISVIGLGLAVRNLVKVMRHE